ncbi:MAG: M20/M25/M40 family metallo-hydrolase, partial [Bacteroidales bacterium]|nr:M20/M25/M40 family metallo-hydrolase [Bacteroidales bacterium]
MNNVKQYIEANKDRFLEELFSLIRIPSISAESEHKDDMVRCANRWKELLLEAGCDRAEVMPSAGNPVVYGEKTIDPAKPTVLVYGHYDVMPVAPLELWRTQPFEPVIKDDKIWARGADDDKG